MRGRGALIFAWGFLAGLVTLTGILWRNGRLFQPSAPVVSAAPTPAAKPPPPAPSLPLPATPTATGEASRTAPSYQSADVEALPLENLAMPVAGYDPARLTDTYNETRGGTRKHEALDIMAPRGTPVVAADNGRVVKLFNSKPGGLTVYQFDPSEIYCFYYAHLDRYAEGLAEGQVLKKGDLVGYVGSTGDAWENAPHLHFAIFKLGPEKRWWQGTPMNPYPLLAKK